jgi:hypothetical protein
METIAFSTKSLDWKTRYSFQPLHYARSGTDLISFSRSEDEAGVHLHDSNDEYNKFYGTASPSKLSVITNNNPSATKIYEAFSFEATKGGWSTKFTTETGEKQEGSVVPEHLVEKEGKFYSSVPQNELNIKAVTKLVGESTVGEIAKQSISLSSRLFSIPGSYIGLIFPKTTDVENVDLDALIAMSQAQNLGETIGFFNVAENEQSEGFFYLQNITNSNSPFDWSFSQAYPYITGYDPYSNSLTVNDLYAGHLAEEIKRHLSISEQSFEEAQKYPVKILSFSTISQNGEDMRGEFMKIDVERSGTDYYELFAINVDQHQTKLDHSLGQNN